MKKFKFKSAEYIEHLELKLSRFVASQLQAGLRSVKQHQNGEFTVTGEFTHDGMDFVEFEVDGYEANTPIEWIEYLDDIELPTLTNIDPKYCNCNYPSPKLHKHFTFSYELCQNCRKEIK